MMLYRESCRHKYWITEAKYKAAISVYVNAGKQLKLEINASVHLNTGLYHGQRI